MHLSMTVDHQVVDGAPAMEFAVYVGSLLENPYLLFA
ncbi:MAG: 2-oxo acid dehydrogenase subunit E2 [Dehalococcoidia bacterium]|nr:2-oxo acid dehydrogenase subunit E2 [Dehalococcoidia bacterium]